MDDDLICNFKKCRKRLKGVAWVTSCSHVFCEEDGTREFGKQPACPACETPLSGQYDIVKTELQPNEQYKSMVLAGQRPEVIMEICSRAMSFWTYQAHQERAYQEYLASKATEKAQQQESYYEHLIAVNQSEVTSLKSQVISTKRELESIKTKHSEASEKLLEKTRQYQKLQGMYEALRRRNVTPASFDGERDRTTPRRHAHYRQFEMPLGAMPENEAVLPHGLHKRQVHGTDTMAITSASSGSLSSLQHQGQSLHSDPSLAAAVASHAHTSQSKHQHSIEDKSQDNFSFKAHHQHVTGVAMYQRSSKS